MDDNSKRTTIALILSIAIIFFYTQTSKNTRAMHAKQQQMAQQQEVINLPKVDANTTQQNVTFQPPTNPSAEKEQLLKKATAFSEKGTTTIETDFAIVEISHTGGRVLSYKLKDFKNTIDGTALKDIVNRSNAIPPLGVYIGNENDAAVNYVLSSFSNGVSYSNDHFKLTGEQVLELNFEGTLANGIAIKKSLRFSNQNYYFNVNVTTSAAINNERIWLEWTSFESSDNEQTRWNPKNFTLLQQSGDRDIISFPELGPTFKAYETEWVVSGDNYFISAVIPAIKHGQNTLLAAQTRLNVGTLTFARFAGDKTSANYTLYGGPKEVHALEALPEGLEQSIDLGFFAFIGQPILLILELFYSIFHNYGLAIILLTLLVKTLLLPLTCKSFKSMRAMQDLKPEMDALRERIKDPNQLNLALMELYKRKGVNPMGGCLPLLIQMPVFFGMYNALRVSFNLRHQPFALWINDLAAPEALPLFGINVPIMILIMGAAMLIQQITTPSPGMSPEQRKMMYITPIIFTVMFLFWPFPSGLVLYMLVNNFISIAQQVALRSESKITPLQATAIGSIVIFGCGYILTLL